MKGKIAVSFDLNQNANEGEKLNQQDIPDGLFIDQENNFLPPPEYDQNFEIRFIFYRKVLPPKLFVIKNNNTGSEYLNDFQLKHYFRIKEKVCVIFVS